MQKTNSYKGLDVFRWIILLPAICFTWWVCMMICVWIEHFFYSSTLWNLSKNVFIIFTLLDLLILPTIAGFFVSRIIAPKYKKHVGLFAIVLCVLWFAFLIYGLSHMAY